MNSKKEIAATMMMKLVPKMKMNPSVLAAALRILTMNMMTNQSPTTQK